MPGSLDTTFDSDGIAITDFSGGFDSATSVAVQGDGKIVTAGSSGGAMALARHNSDGALDTSFGSGGKAIFTYPTYTPNGRGMAIQSDGRIVVVGSWYNGTNTDIAVARWTSAGVLDTTFNSTGYVTAGIGRGQDVEIQNDGKILVAGDSDSPPVGGFIVARFNVNGSPDSAFNSTGTAIAQLGELHYVESMALQADGKILVTGWVGIYNISTSYYDWSIGIARFNTDGTLDTAFDSDGMLLISSNNSDLGIPGVGITAQNDGKIVIASRYDNTQPPPLGGGSMDICIWRLNSDGSMDTTFDGDGRATTDMSGDKHDCAYQVAVQGDGKIVVAGLAGFYQGGNPKIAVVRFNSNGSLDTSFNSTGKVETDISFPGSPTANYALGLALQPNGRILVAGASGFDFATLRYLAADVPEISVEEPAGSPLVDGAGINFGNVGNGVTSAPKTVTIRNVGTLNLTGLAVTKSGANAGDFTLGTLGATTLPPGGSTSFTVTFTPASTGARSAALQIASNDSDENPFDINLTGTGVVPAPEIAVCDINGRDLTDAGSGFLMGGSPVGMGVTETLTVTNAGSGTLSGLGVSISGPDASQFIASTLGSSTLPPGGSTTFNITFTPASTGSKSASIHLASNDADENPFEIVVRGGGTATQLPALHVVKPVDGSGAGSFAETYNAPAPCVMANGWLFFVASNGVTDSTLWRSDGTEAGTAIVKPDAPGIAVPFFSTMPGFDQPRLTVMGDKVYFLAQVYLDGMPTDFALWKSDGTQGGTAVVKGGLYSDGSGEAAVVTNGLLFFVASDGVNGAELWKSDGTTGGTMMVKDIKTGGPVPMNGSYPQQLTLAGNLVFFSADNGTNGRELWKSDGTAAGTALVKDVLPGSAGAISFNAWERSPLTESAGLLFFTANDGTNGYELWKSDGTAAGTMMVKDIYPGSGSGAGPTPTEGNSLTDVNGTIFFTGGDSTTGREMWKSNGTAGGTVLVKDISPGIGESSPRNLANMGGTLFALAFDENFDGELWRSDGTAAGTVRVKDINPTGSSFPSPIAFMNGLAFFVADDGAHGSELWGTDGTGTGTWLVADLNAGSGASGPALASVVGKRLYFVAADGPFTRALHVLSAEPEIVLSGNSTNIADGDATPATADHTDFGSVSATSGTVTRTFTVTNTGTANLTLGTVTVGGANAADFAVTTQPGSPVTPGNNTTFQITFDPSAAGLRAATLSFSNNDADENPFDFSIQGTGTLTAQETWRQTYFGTTSNSGNAADGADPDFDGVVNYLEFATGANPNASTAMPGQAALAGGNVEFTYTRSNAAVAGGTTYVVEWSDTLPNAAWSTADVTQAMLSDNGTMQQWKATLSAGASGRRFVRLSVSQGVPVLPEPPPGPVED